MGYNKRKERKTGEFGIWVGRRVGGREGGRVYLLLVPFFVLTSGSIDYLNPLDLAETSIVFHMDPLAITERCLLHSPS